MVYPGSTMRITAVIRDPSGALVDPLEHDIKVYDDRYDKIMDFDAAKRISKGKYVVEFVIPDDLKLGHYKVAWESMWLGYKAYREVDFIVEEAEIALEEPKIHELVVELELGSAILRFLGTKGDIEESSKKHQMHSALLVEYKQTRLLIDFGESWKSKLNNINPTDILLTHAHPDHSWGIDTETNIPVYASVYTFNALKGDVTNAIKNPIRMLRYRSYTIGDIVVKSIPVEHSVRAPTTGYILKLGSRRVGYFPDLLRFPKHRTELGHLDVYIGDGSYPEHKPGRVRYDTASGHRFGHATIEQQIKWAKEAGASTIFFTHFGKFAVENHEKLAKSFSDFESRYNIALFEAVDGFAFYFTGLQEGVYELGTGLFEYLSSIKVLENLSGIYLVEPHGRLIAERKKTIIVSTEPTPQAYLNKEIFFIDDKKAYGTLTITKCDGPLPIYNVKNDLKEKHQISNNEWNKWWPDKKEFYVYEFKIDKILDEPVPVEVEQGVQKWIKEVKINLPVKKSLVTPDQVKNILDDPSLLQRRWDKMNLVEFHHIAHMWRGANWRSCPKDLTHAQVTRFHNLLVAELKRRLKDFHHKTDMQTPEEIGKQAREPSMYLPIQHYGDEVGREISIEEVLHALDKPILLTKGYVKVVGGVPNWGSSLNDIDFRIAETDKGKFHIVAFRLGRGLPGELADRSQFHNGSKETFTSYVDVYDLALIPSTEQKLVRMEEKSYYSEKKCMRCEEPPTIRVLWANGKALAWFCNKHFEEWKKESNEMSDSGTNEGDIVRTEAIVNKEVK